MLDGCFGISLFIIVSIFLTPLLKFFGSTSEILPYAHTYTNYINWITISYNVHWNE